MSEASLAVLLPWLLIVPTAAAILVALFGSGRTPFVRWLSLLATVVNLLIAFVVAMALLGARESGAADVASAEVPTFHPHYVTQGTILQLGPGAGEAIQFYIGLDGLNVWLVLLTAVLMVPAVLISWTSIEQRIPEYHAWLLLLETGMLGVFLAFDIVLFYVFFELTLVPLFFLIGIWGGPERRYAARKFFIYTLTGSLITLLGVLGIVLACYTDANIHQLTFSIPKLVSLVNERLDYLRQNPMNFHADLVFWQNLQLWVFIALMAGFAVKVPLVPLHTWLPLAHVEAPTAGSVLLAGVLLKIGTYGFMRLCIPLAPDASVTFGAPVIGTLAVMGIVYGAFCALAQEDIKKLVAYSSVSHLGFCMLGMFALNQAGLSGGLLQMINHGLSTGALFLLVGMLYERYHTRLMSDYGGMGAKLGLLALAMVFFSLSSIGLPGLNGFVGEVLCLMGMFDAEWLAGYWPALAVVGATGVVLGAWYLLTMLRRVFFGPYHEPPHQGEGAIADLGGRELLAIVPLAALCIFLGVYPQPVLDTSHPALDVVAELARRAATAGQAVARLEPPADATAKFAIDQTPTANLK